MNKPLPSPNLLLYFPARVYQCFVYICDGAFSVLSCGQVFLSVLCGGNFYISICQAEREKERGGRESNSVNLRSNEKCLCETKSPTNFLRMYIDCLHLRRICIGCVGGRCPANAKLSIRISCTCLACKSCRFPLEQIT